MTCFYQICSDYSNMWLYLMKHEHNLENTYLLIKEKYNILYNHHIVYPLPKNECCFLNHIKCLFLISIVSKFIEYNRTAIYLFFLILHLNFLMHLLWLLLQLVALEVQINIFNCKFIPKIVFSISPNFLP